jgi:phytoene desaturase
VKIVVVGAGFGGLAAAIRLQAAGHEVHLIEQQDQPGGRARVFRRDGFTFDAGPTIITAPWLLEELFAASGADLHEAIQLVRLDPAYRVRFPDGSAFDYRCDEAALEAEVRRFEPRDVQGYRRFSATSEDIYRRAMPLIARPFHRLSDMLRVIPDLARIRADRSVAALAAQCFSDSRLQQVFSFHPLLIGGHPFRTPAIYALIHALEKDGGVWFAMGGMHAVVDALTRRFSDLGGDLRLGTRVVGFPRQGRRVKGVELENGEHVVADAVVSNADLASLSPSDVTQARIRRRRYSMSAFVLYFGTRRRYDEMAAHEMIMGPRYRGLLDEVFGHGALSDDFSLYLYRPTAVDDRLAPPGCDAFYALVPVPNLAAEVDWEREAPRLRDRVLAHLERHYLPALGAYLATEHWIDPRSFRDDLGSYLGAAFSLQPTFLQSAWFRPHNVSAEFDNFYVVGAGTHPGPGVPGVLSSARIVADLIGPAARGPSRRPHVAVSGT